MSHAQSPDPDPQLLAAAAEERVGYFMVRIRRLPTDPPGEVTGVVERLGSGEKRTFRTSSELARVVDDWSMRRRSGW
jgi:hypothetical protein